jgi:hypothetical protein
MVKPSSQAGKGLRDGREPLTIDLPSALIRDLKMAALQAGTSASALIEKAIVTLLKSHCPKN